MRIRDTFESFLRGIDKFRVASVTPSDFLYWYHLAQQDYVDQRLTYFEMAGTFDDDISAFLLQRQYVATDLIDPSSPFRRFALPVDYFRTSLVTCGFRFTNNCGKPEQGVKKANRLTGDKLGFIIDNPYYKPSRERWYYRMSAGKLQLYGDSLSQVESVELDYVRILPLLTPDDITADTDTEWKKDQSDKIAQKASALFLENKQSPRVASYPQVNKVDQL